MLDHGGAAAAARRLGPEATRGVAGWWRRPRAIGREAAGKRPGLVGLGAIARETRAWGATSA